MQTSKIKGIKKLLLRAPTNSSVGRRFFASQRGGRKGWNVLAVKLKARTVVGRGEERLLSDPGSELRVRKERARGIAKIVDVGLYFRSTIHIPQDIRQL